MITQGKLAIRDKKCVRCSKVDSRLCYGLEDKRCGTCMRDLKGCETVVVESKCDRSAVLEGSRRRNEEVRTTRKSKGKAVEGSSPVRATRLSKIKSPATIEGAWSCGDAQEYRLTGRSQR